jgi:hypothetical protein
MKKRIVSQGLTGVLAAAMVLGSVVMPLNVQAEESTEDIVVEVVLAEEDMIAAEEVTEENTVIEDESLTEEDAENVEVEMQEYVLENSPASDQVAQREEQRQKFIGSVRTLRVRIFDIWRAIGETEPEADGVILPLISYEAQAVMIDEILTQLSVTDAFAERTLDTYSTWIPAVTIEIDPLWTLSDLFGQVWVGINVDNEREELPLNAAEREAVETYFTQLTERLRTQQHYTSAEIATITDELWNILELNHIPGYGAIEAGANNNTANNNTANNNTANNSTTNNAETQANASTQTDASGKSAKVTAPNTGDMANAIMYASLVLLASGAIATVAIRKKRVA